MWLPRLVVVGKWPIGFILLSVGFVVIVVRFWTLFFVFGGGFLCLDVFVFVRRCGLLLLVGGVRRGGHSSRIFFLGVVVIR